MQGSGGGSNGSILYRPIDVILDSTNSENQTGSLDKPRYNIFPALTNIVGMAILWTNIPFTYFVIDDTCDNFTFTTGGTPYVISLEPGTYTSATLGANVSTLIQVATGNVSFNTYVDSDSGKFVFYSTGAGKAAFFVTVPTDSPLGNVLGFDTSTPIASSAAVDFLDNKGLSLNGYYLQGSSVANVTGPNQIYVHSSLGSLAYGCVRTQTNASDLIGFVPVTANFGGYIENIVSYPQMIPITKSNITCMDFYLSLGNRTRYSVYGRSDVTDQSGAAMSTVNYLPLQGEGWQIAIRFYQQDLTNQYVAATAHHSEVQSINKGRRGPDRRHVLY